MPRRNDRSVLDDLFEAFIECPTWVGPLIAAIVYVVMNWLIPIWAQSQKPTHLPDFVSKINSELPRLFAPYFAGIVLLVWVIAEIRKFSTREKFNRVKPSRDVPKLSWQEFEELLSEVFRREGYSVEHSGKSGPDDGVDHRLFKDGKRILVQCKHWRQEQVGVSIIRELLGVIVHEGADAGIVVTSGTFTQESIKFAEQNLIRLINGNELQLLVQSLQKSKMELRRQASPEKATIPNCPHCGSSMAKRIAKKGPNAGEGFWGCTKFPQCRGTRSL